jgi:ribonuclease R
MQQARYSAEHTGHFGLASDHYTHFTSPIRRYPDLIVHRQLCRLLLTGEPGARHARPERSSPIGQLPEDARHLSERERNAVAAEREMVDRLACRFMSRHLGETFSAVISGVSETAFFVELLDFAVSGIVSLSALTDDYYLLDQKRHRLVGDISGQTLQIGNLVQVVLAAIDFNQNKLQFELEQPRKKRKSAAPH